MKKKKQQQQGEMEQNTPFPSVDPQGHKSGLIMGEGKVLNYVSFELDFRTFLFMNM